MTYWSLCTSTKSVSVGGKEIKEIAASVIKTFFEKQCAIIEREIIKKMLANAKKGKMTTNFEYSFTSDFDQNVFLPFMLCLNHKMFGKGINLSYSHIYSTKRFSKFKIVIDFNISLVNTIK